MQASASLINFTCPNCGRKVDESARQCEAFKADFSGPQSWKPWKNGVEPETEPSTFFLSCFVAGSGLLIFLAYFATWGVRGTTHTVSAIAAEAFFRFPIVALLLSMAAGFVASFVLLHGARLPGSQWPTAILGWATFFLGLVLVAMGPLRFMTFWLVPYPLVPCVLLYLIGIVLVLVRLRRTRTTSAREGEPLSGAP
jgi:hypothetical protein